MIAPFSHLKRLPRPVKALFCACVVSLSGCASGPPAQEWELNAQASLKNSVAAYLAGNNKVQAQETVRWRGEITKTARPDLLAQAELVQCAAQVASLVFEPCTAFEQLAPDATATQRAYADFLSGNWDKVDSKLLPAHHQPLVSSQSDITSLQSIEDPLSRLVAAAVLLQRNRLSPTAMAQAVETASTQGWRRPLLAWLNIEAQRAEQAGQSEDAARLRRRIALAQEAWPKK